MNKCLKEVEEGTIGRPRGRALWAEGQQRQDAVGSVVTWLGQGTRAVEGELSIAFLSNCLHGPADTAPQALTREPRV